ncbi:DsbA family oxidoreductase [Streptomyces sp. DH10]|uniref:DsbA family oxidoreductase n=1 Tax=Streptomyces sp. DH10 TaxID=3040121 RepID=UPI002442ECE1|nr:DsbA family protein [Streptomyces sp. DH10]MDG9710642.1 DsbA family protein [Streptomyces sp. DH10]
MHRTHRVEAVLDFVCVHCHLGFIRYLRAVRRYRADGGTVETVLRPVQLRPQASPVGEPLVEVWARERGAAVAARLAADTSFGAEDGLELDFRRAVFTNTFDAHRLAAQASAQGKGEEMAERLFRAYFADGLNIADTAVLDRLAAETSVMTTSGGAEVLQVELARVRALDLPVPPVFLLAGGPVLSGGIREDDILAALGE